MTLLKIVCKVEMREEGEQKPRLPRAVELVGGRMEAMSVDSSLYNDGLEGKEGTRRTWTQDAQEVCFLLLKDRRDWRIFKCRCERTRSNGKVEEWVQEKLLRKRMECLWRIYCTLGT